MGVPMAPAPLTARTMMEVMEMTEGAGQAVVEMVETTDAGSAAVQEVQEVTAAQDSPHQAPDATSKSGTRGAQSVTACSPRPAAP